MMTFALSFLADPRLNVVLHIPRYSVVYQPSDYSGSRV